jgi:hypothetical protein
MEDPPEEHDIADHYVDELSIPALSLQISGSDRDQDNHSYIGIYQQKSNKVCLVQWNTPRVIVLTLE